MPRPWKIALISTDHDLKYLRDPVAAKIKESGCDALAFEEDDYPVAPHVHSHDACLQALQLADIVVVMVDVRYGGIYVGDSNRSITEAEYNLAMQEGKIVIPCVAAKAEQARFEFFRLEQEWKERFRFIPKKMCRWVNRPSYVQNWKVLDFIQKLNSASTDNFRITFDSTTDLIKKLIGRFEGLTRHFCHEILKFECASVKRKRTTTGVILSLGDVIDEGYFTEPDYAIRSGQLPAGDDLVSKIELNDNKHRVMVLGEPGSGKSTLLAKCFLSHAHKSIQDHSPIIPLYLDLRGLGVAYHFDIEEYYTELFRQHFDKSLYPYIDTQQVSFVVYVDGFDELAEQAFETDLKAVTESEFFQSAFVVCSRTRFAHTQLDGTGFSNEIDTIIELLPWSPAKAWAYVRTFFNKQGRLDLLSKFESAYKNQPEYDAIEHLMQNPLSLTMFLWIVKESDLELPPKVPNQIQLYDTFLNLWVHREYTRLRSADGNRNHLVKLTLEAWRVSSWLIYKNRFEKKMVTKDELRDWLKQNWPDLIAITDHNAFWDFFDIKPYSGQVGGMFHEQFMEHLLAKTIVETIDSGKPPFPDYLDYPIRYEVNHIIKSLWDRPAANGLETSFGRLTEVYESSIEDDTNRGIARRNHAVYYLGRLPYAKCREYLKSKASSEKSLFVKSSIAFSLIMMGDIEEEDIFYSLLINDSEMDEINRGYHLVYYGDWGLTGEPPPYHDKGKHSWEHTFFALMRHIQSNEKRYFMLRRIELYTMRRLMETRKEVRPLTKSTIRKIESCVKIVQEEYKEFGAKVLEEYILLKLAFTSFDKS